MNKSQERPIQLLYFFIPGVIVFFSIASAVFWWIDSAVTCDEQESYTLRGYCLYKTRSKAESGDVNSQWRYGFYLEDHQQANEAYLWYRKAAPKSTRATQISHITALCDANMPDFGPDQVEENLIRVTKISPDGHQMLLHFYNEGLCGKFSLDKASAQIPLLTQCTAFGMSRFLEKAKEHGFVLTGQLKSSMLVNLDLCVTKKTTFPSSTLVEIVEPSPGALAQYRKEIVEYANQ